MQAYKALYLDKAQGAIFGPEANGEKSGGKKDPDAMEIDEIQKKEGKSSQYCQICAVLVTDRERQWCQEGT